MSIPIAWEQLEELKSAAYWTIATAREYVSLRGADPWASYWRKRQSLTKALKMLRIGV